MVVAVLFYIVIMSSDAIHLSLGPTSAVACCQVNNGMLTLPTDILPRHDYSVNTRPHQQSCGLGLEVSVSRRTNVLSRFRLGKNCKSLGLVLVSAIYVSCPRPIFGQIVQATLINRVNLNAV